jgi:hypothetical protein
VSFSRWMHTLMRVAAVTTAATLLASVATAQAVAADFTWTGGAPLVSAQWSNPLNWGGTAPAGSVGTLTFPKLTQPACTTSPRANDCYNAVNDVAGLSVAAISLDHGARDADNAPYQISGLPISLGAGGLTASTTASTQGTASIGLPITLSASQTWAIDGNDNNSQVSLTGNVTGSAATTLGIVLSHQTFLGLNAGNDMEVGPVTISGGDLSILTPNLNGSMGISPGSGLNAVGQQPVSLVHAGIVGFNGTIGPLTTSHGNVQVGQAAGAATGGLAVAGSLTLDSASSVSMILHAGTTPAVHYSQLTATGTIDLAGAHLLPSAITGSGGACVALHPGDVDTIISTTGSLQGTFSGMADGSTITIGCNSITDQPQARINYTAHTVTLTVLAPTDTSLVAVPASPVTNESVTLTATVAATSGTPSGTVAFLDSGTPIAGCASRPVTLVAGAYSATCVTSFAAVATGDWLDAAFTPDSASQAGSTDRIFELTVGKDATTTGVSVSSATPAVGASVTFTATVTPAHSGPATPSGSVEFLDGATPIAACATAPLTASTATCSVSYTAAGSHAITGRYLADDNFAESGPSAPQPLTVTAATPSETTLPPPVAPPPAPPVAPPPPPPPPPDTTAPVATLGGAAQRLAARVAVTVSCASEACSTKTTGSVRVPTIGRAAGRTYTLKAVRTQIAKGAKVTIRLTLAPSARAAIRRALAARKRVIVVVKVTISDAAGNKRVLTRQVPLKS